MISLQQLITQIDDKKQQLATLRPIKPEYLVKIKKKMWIAYNYHSNHLEWNSLTYQETRSFLETGLIQASSKVKKHQDYKEIEWHNKAINHLWLLDTLHYTEALIQKESLQLTQNDMRQLHQLILVEDHKIQRRDENGEVYRVEIKVWQYKSRDNHVTRKNGELLRFVSAGNETEATMKDLVDWLHTNLTQHHPLVVASMFHYKFIRIHPFDDGNGRMARLLMNMILMYFGYPLIIVPSGPQDKEEYYQSLELTDALLPDTHDAIQSNNSDLFEPLVSYLARQLSQSLDWVIAGAQGEEIIDADDMLQQFALEMKEKNHEKHNEKKREWIEKNDNRLLFYDNVLFPVIQTVNKFTDTIRPSYQWRWMSVSIESPHKTATSIPKKETIRDMFALHYKKLIIDNDKPDQVQKMVSHTYTIDLQWIKNQSLERNDRITVTREYHPWLIKITIFCYFDGVGTAMEYTKPYWDLSPVDETRSIVKNIIQLYQKGQ